MTAPLPYWEKVRREAARRIARGVPRAQAFTRGQRMEARIWHTCRCGRAHPLIERSADGSPLDKKMFDLGVQFYQAVLDGDVEGVDQVGKKIDKREVTLVKETVRKLRREFRLTDKMPAEQAEAYFMEMRDRHVGMTVAQLRQAVGLAEKAPNTEEGSR